MGAVLNFVLNQFCGYILQIARWKVFLSNGQQNLIKKSPTASNFGWPSNVYKTVDNALTKIRQKMEPKQIQVQIVQLRPQEISSNVSVAYSVYRNAVSP